MGNEKNREAGSRAHCKLQAWKVPGELVKKAYLLPQVYPKEEMFGLTAQTART